jgi:hypothetical protein
MATRILRSEKLFKLLDMVSPGSIGITLYPFIILRDSWYNRTTQKGIELTINHERIHIRQQIELLVVGFYLWYFMEWIYRALTGANPYYSISFEREAYRNEANPDYLKTRRFWAHLRYLNPRKF